jgi:hypothetical protein
VVWVRGFLEDYPPMGGIVFHADLMHDMELAIRFDPPLPRSGPRDAAIAIVQRLNEDSPEAIDVLDFLLGRLREHNPFLVWDDSAARLKQILDTGGSVWEVAVDEGERYRLRRRLVGPVTEAIDEVGSVSERAGDHLREARAQLLGVHSDPSAAYQSAVAAVEVAAKPVVSPKNQDTTLGTIRRDMRAKPEKWEFELGADVQIVIDMISTLWENQRRHGDEEAPLSETQEQADAAVHLAITLVRWFTSGAIRRTAAAGEAGGGEVDPVPA